MTILGIETSCDETAVAVVESTNSHHKVLASIVSSQVKTHAKYGGVVPNLASREHLKNVIPCLKQGFSQAKVLMKDIDVIAVTIGPGLIPALLIGTNTAKALAFRWRKSIIGVNHIEGHIYANWINPIRVSSRFKVQGSRSLFPVLCLVISGGHTQLILMKDHGKYKLLGETRDDAVGEAFDKVAKLLGLGYPGGPVIEKKAKSGDSQAFDLPRPMIKTEDFDFSFSGLKTAMLYLVKKGVANFIPDICASFQQAIIDVLITKTSRAAKECKAKTVMLAGGVAANEELRRQFRGQARSLFLPFLVPPKKYCTDNAVMVAVCAYYRALREGVGDWRDIKADANLKIV